MLKRFRIVGLCLVAVFAVTAVGASAAFAEGTSDEFEYLGTATTWEGNQTTNHVFKGEAGTVSCKKAHFAGPVPSGKKSATTEATTIAYSECTAFGFIGAAVAVANCKYVFNQPTDLEGEPETGADEKHEGTVSLVNNGGTCVIRVSVSGTNCVITFKEQLNLGIMLYDNLPKPSGPPFKPAYKELEVETALTGLEYTQTGSQCTGGAGTFFNGTYAGKVRVKESFIN